MTKEELKQWEILKNQYVNGNHLSKEDWQELIRLNHLLMEITHDIHNNNMLKDRSL